MKDTIMLGIFDKFIDGLVVSLIGIGATFIIMLILIGFICLVKYVMKFINKDNVLPPKKEISLPEEKNDSNSAFEGIDTAVVAAICAAINCYIGSDGGKVKPKAGFIVRNIRKL